MTKPTTPTFMIEAFTFLDWWNDQTIAMQQDWLKRHTDDSNRVVALANLKKIDNATEKQIRDHYRTRDMMVRISRDGHVRYRTNASHIRNNRAWREGGYVENYFVTADGNVHLV